MKPTSFKGQNIILGKDQPEYLDLPALRCDDEAGTTWSCWELDDADLADMIKHRKIWVGQLTFGRPFSPQMITTSMPLEVSVAAYKEREEPHVLLFDCPVDCVGSGYGQDGHTYYGVLRYAEGSWIPADGKPDLAFVGFTIGGAPVFYGVDIQGEVASNHPNRVAYNSAASVCSARSGCGTGRVVAREVAKAEKISKVTTY